MASSPAADGSSLTSDIALRLEIKKDQARVSNFENGIWREIEPNRFKFVSLKTNALVYLMHEGKVPTPNGSRWVETYLLSITLQDESTLLGRWVRVVNNIDIPKDNSERAFTVDGEFRMTKGLRAR